MPDIGAYEAKTQLPKLLERVQQGERFVITKHGRPVAELVPAAARDAARIRETIAGMRERRAALVRLGVRLADILRPSETLRDRVVGSGLDMTHSWAIVVDEAIPDRRNCASCKAPPLGWPRLPSPACAPGLKAPPRDTARRQPPRRAKPPCRW